MKLLVLAVTVLLVSLKAHAHHHDGQTDSDHTHGALAECSEMEVWDYSRDMCMPLAMAGMPMKMAMLHFDSFFTQTFEEGPRGKNAFSVPNMFMADIGSSVGNRHYLNLDIMGTFERWSFPKSGTPELLQIGEENADHRPYLDAQHPHSSPIMGITLSDTITLSGKDNLKFSFAPRGEASEGPVAFMHRPTGAVNPDAPLGHHIGQDVGHIASTVLGASLTLGGSTIEATTFNGTEPEPSKVDLPMGEMNSYAARFTQEFNEHFYAMASAAYVKKPESHDPNLDHIWRYSSSIYNDHTFQNGWTLHNAFIWGLVNYYDEAAALNSFAEELLIQNGKKNFWSRIERLQRTPNELAIASSNPNDGKWVTAVTLGYTHKIANWDFTEIGLGGSVTKDILPGEYRGAYGGDPLTAKVFLQFGGMKMWNL